MDKKIAVILFNLGGPDSAKAVKPFLFNLFYDKAIINLPNPFRWLLAKFISARREKTAINIYKQIGGKSPILEETELQAFALEKALNKDDAGKKYKIFSCMRYWKPFSKEVVQKIKEDHFDEVILLPLYPQFSTTTTGSSIDDFILNSRDLKIPIKKICCYYDDPLFAKGYAELINKTVSNNKLDDFRILFSAHGLPKKIIDEGDPYQYQVEESVKKIIANIKAKIIDYKVCYQSKVGPLEWLQPNTEDEIIKAAREGKQIIIVPVAFVSEHSETLVELDMEYKERFYKNGGKEFFRVSTVRNNKYFIEALAKLCKKVQIEEGSMCYYSGKRCPKKFNKCLNNG